jgi:glycosyltransferase involved in cell wall biosynthesis
MRVLTVCTSTQIFGAEIASLNILLAFQERGYQQLAVTSSWTDGNFSKRLAALGVSEVALPLGVLSKRISPRALWWTFNALVRAPKLWLGWHRTINAFCPDVLLLTNPKQGLWLYPWLDIQPSFLIESSMKAVTTANRWMYAQLQRKLSGFVAVSRFMDGHLRDLGVDPKLIQVIYNCCRISSGDISGHVRSRLNSPVRVGIAGQISPHKGHDVLFQAAELLKKRGVHFEVLVFGAGQPEYISDLRERIKLAGLIHQWKWMGYAEDQQQMYRSMDICVVPSCFDEPFGMVALEASRYGVPVVAARRGGLPEIVEHGSSGFLVEPESAAEFADRLNWLIQNPEHAHSMGLRGREKVLREFTQEKMVSDFEKIFNFTSRKSFMRGQLTDANGISCK